MNGNSFDDWPAAEGSQNDLGHVMTPEEEIHLFPNHYPMQSFENLSGYGGKQNLQVLDHSALNLSQPNNGSTPRNSKSSQYRVPHIQTSLPLPPGYQGLDVAHLEYQSQSINPQDLFHFHTSQQLPSIPNSSTSSTSFDMPALTTSSSTSGSLHNYHALPSNKLLQVAKPQPRRLQSSRSSSSFSDNLIKQRKSRSSAGKRSVRASQPKKALAQFEEALKPQYPKLSKGIQQQFQLLFAQMKLLMDKEIEDGNLEGDFDEMSVTTLSSTQYSLVASEVLDSVHSTEAGSSVSSTPRPQTFDAQDATPMDAEPEAPVRYYCTYPTCKVSQKECKGRHKKCQCPVNRERYWCTSKVDIKRHEEGLEHYPKKTFVCFECFVVDVFGAMCKFCSMPILDDPKTHYTQCERARANTKTFSRKDHLLGHLQRQHGSKNMGEETKSWSFQVDSDWPRQCGFCPVIFDSWDQRMSHIASHFDHGARIQDWRFPPVEPKDRKPPGSFFPIYRKDEDEDDDDNDNGFGGSGGGPRGKLSGDGTFAGATQQTQYGQSSSSQDYGSYSQQEYYQQGYGASQLHVSAAIQTRNEHQVPQTPQSSVKLSLALERYLKDPGDRVPGLGTAPRITSKQPMPRAQPPAPITSIRKTLLSSGGERAKPTAKGAILLSALPGGEKMFLVRQYIRQHWNELDQGIFWVNARIQPEVKDSFLDITVQTVLSLPANAPLKCRFFHYWWQNTGQSLCRTLFKWGLPSVSHVQLDQLRPKTIFLVGGFGESKYLKMKLKQPPRNTEIPQPGNNWSAVCRSGVLLKGMDEKSISCEWKTPFKLRSDQINDSSSQERMDAYPTENPTSARFTTIHKISEITVAQKNTLERHSWKQIRTITDDSKQLARHSTEVLSVDPPYQSQAMTGRRRRQKKFPGLAEPDISRAKELYRLAENTLLSRMVAGQECRVRIRRNVRSRRIGDYKGRRETYDGAQPRCVPEAQNAMPPAMTAFGPVAAAYRVGRLNIDVKNSSPDQYPSLISFDGQTGNGKSTLIRALTDNAASDTTHQNSVPGITTDFTKSNSGDIDSIAIQTTIPRTGIDNWGWTAYGFMDSEERVDCYLRYNKTVPHPASPGNLQSGQSHDNPCAKSDDLLWLTKLLPPSASFLWQDSLKTKRDMAFVTDDPGQVQLWRQVMGILRVLAAKLEKDDDDDMDLGLRGAIDTRSFLLEDFRPTPKSTKRYELKDIYAHVVKYSGYQHGSRFIRQGLETADSNKKEEISQEIHRNRVSVAEDGFGTYTSETSYINPSLEDVHQDQAPQHRNPIYARTLEKCGRTIFAMPREKAWTIEVDFGTTFTHIAYTWIIPEDARSSSVDENPTGIGRAGVISRWPEGPLWMEDFYINQSSTYAQGRENATGRKLHCQSEDSEHYTIQSFDHDTKGFTRKFDKNRHTLTQSYSSYPIPISPEKFPKALKLYERYLLEKKLSQEAVSGGEPTSSVLSQPTASSTSISSFGYDNEAMSSPDISNWTGGRARHRTRKPLSAETKAKAALIRHLGSCSVCRNRRVPCPLEHHDVDSLGRAYKGTSSGPGSKSATEKSFKRADVFKPHLTSIHGIGDNRTHLDPSHVSCRLSNSLGKGEENSDLRSSTLLHCCRDVYNLRRHEMSSPRFNDFGCAEKMTSLTQIDECSQQSTATTIHDVSNITLPCETPLHDNGFELLADHLQSKSGQHHSKHTGQDVQETLRNNDRDRSNANYQPLEDVTFSECFLSTPDEGRQGSCVDGGGPDLLELIKTIISEEMAVSFEELSDTVELATLGMDSLILLVILSRLREQTGANLPGSFFNDYPTIGAAASKLNALVYDQRLDKFGRAIDSLSTVARSGSVESWYLMDEWACPPCIEPILSSRPPGYNPDNCSRIDFEGSATLPQYSSSESYASSIASVHCPEGPEHSPHSAYLPLAPDVELNKRYQRRSSPLHADISFERDPMTGHPHEFDTTIPAFGLRQNTDIPYWAPATKNKRRKLNDYGTKDDALRRQDSGLGSENLAWESEHDKCEDCMMSLFEVDCESATDSD